MAGGDYDQRVAPRSADEVGRLAVAFNDMAAELAEVDRQRRDLVANVSHELRTPISALRATLENIVDGVGAGRPRAAAARCSSQTERLQRLVTQLLDLSRLESAGRRCTAGRSASADLLEQVADEARLHARDLASRSASSPPDLDVDGDPERLHQVRGQPRRERRRATARRTARCVLRAPSPRAHGRDRGARPRSRHRRGGREPGLRALLPGRRRPRLRRRRRRPRPGHRPLDRGPARRPHPRRAPPAPRLSDGGRAAGAVDADRRARPATACWTAPATVDPTRAVAARRRPRRPIRSAQEAPMSDPSPEPTASRPRTSSGSGSRPLQFEVTQNAGTEPAFTGEYWDTHDPGVYHCIVCGEPLFSRDTKFESGRVAVVLAGDRPRQGQAHRGPLARHDPHRGPLRDRCDAHLGHVFPDGPQPTGERYCMNSASLKLEPQLDRRRRRRGRPDAPTSVASRGRAVLSDPAHHASTRPRRSAGRPRPADRRLRPAGCVPRPRSTSGSPRSGPRSPSQRDGSVLITETIAYDFGTSTSHHGIERIMPTRGSATTT